MTRRTLAVLAVATTLAVAGAVLPHVLAHASIAAEVVEATPDLDATPRQGVPVIALLTGLFVGVMAWLTTIIRRQRGSQILALAVAPLVSFVVAEGDVVAAVFGVAA